MSQSVLGYGKYTVYFMHEGYLQNARKREKSWKDYLKYFEVGRTKIEYTSHIHNLRVSQGWLNGLDDAIVKSCDFSKDNTHLIDKTQKIREKIKEKESAL